jgi:uncharacterized membrane protein HdeD (DUF308 family)
MEEKVKIEQLMLAQEWWVLLLQGILALIIGFMILAWPALTLSVLVIFIGAFAFVDGIFALAALSQAEKGRRGLLILQGVCGIAIGIIAFIWTGITLVVLLILFMAWLLVTGIFKLIAAIKLPSGESSKWLLGLNGVLSIIIGVLLISLPGIEGLILTAFLIAFFAIFAGISLVMLGLMLRGKQKEQKAAYPAGGHIWW